MSDRQQDPTQQEQGAPQQGAPERHLAWLLLKLSPLAFVLCYVLAAVQGARWRDSLLIAVVGTLMCLGAAGLYKLRGSKAGSDMVWLNILLRLFTR